MIRRMLAGAGLAMMIAGASTLHAQTVKQQGSNAAAAKAAINKVWTDAIAAAKKGDAAALASFYSDDAIVLDPGAPTTTGRANIHALYKGMLESMKFIDMTVKSSGVQVFGDVAIDNGTFVQTLQEKGKPAFKNESRYEMVFHNVDGKWLIVRDITVPNPAPVKK